MSENLFLKWTKKSKLKLQTESAMRTEFELHCNEQERIKISGI